MKMEHSRRLNSYDFLKEIDASQLKYIRFIASGGMSEIHLYRWTKSESSCRDVAVKRLLMRPIQRRYKSNLRSEMSILSDLQHENIVKTFGTVSIDRSFGLVMEYLPFGSYRCFFDEIRLKFGRSTKAENTLAPLKIQIISEIIAGMIYLHGKIPVVLHLDLKSDNILLDNNLRAKICDFGLSAMRTLASIRASTTSAGEYLPNAVPGTSYCISPTRLLNYEAKPTEKSDVYSFGILEWEILTDKVPFEDTILIKDRYILAENVGSKNARPRIELVPKVFPPELIVMMKQAWAHKPDDRPTFQELGKEICSIKKHISDYDTIVGLSKNEVLHISTNSRDRSASSSPITQSMSDSSASDDLETDESNTVPKLLGQSVSPNAEVIENPERSSSAPPKYEDVVYQGTKIRIAFAVLIGSIITGIVLGLNKVDVHRCHLLSSPRNGDITCAKKTDEITRCNFSCSAGFNLVGNEETFCNGGKWNHPAPICKKSCRHLSKIVNGEITCSDGYNVNSICKVNCVNNHKIKGDEEMTCLDNGLWSHSEPSCVCPDCLVGDKCQYSTSWKLVDLALDSTIPYVTSVAHYGGHVITCNAKLYHGFKYRGKCTDNEKVAQYECKGYDSPSGSVKHAASKLVRWWANAGKYPKPCDSQRMPTNC